MDRKRQKMTPEKVDVQKECQDRKITALERNLEHMENKLKLVITELEQVKEEQTRDKIKLEAEKRELESKIDKYNEQCTELLSENGKLHSENEKLQSKNEKLHNENEKLQSKNENLHCENEKLQSENKKLQKYLEDLESANKNAEEKSPINLFNTDLNYQITKNNEAIDDDALNVNALPNEIILKVFSYLTQNQLGQIARVCRKWNALKMSPFLWRNVNVEIFCSPDSKSNTVTKSFIHELPSCVTFIRLDFSVCEGLDFEELCVKLHQNCPLLEELILAHCRTSNISHEVINFCTQFLLGVKKLVFHCCDFAYYSGTAELNVNSKIEVLDLYCCDIFSPNKLQFSKLLCLKELCLSHTNVDDTWFVDDNSFLNQLHMLDLRDTDITASTFLAIKRQSHNLKELYLCDVNLQAHDLNFNRSVFPHLKTICLSRTHVTCEGVVSLIQSCASLENVYVNEDVAKSFAAHPFVVANKSKSGIVKAIDWGHNHQVNYLQN